MDIYHILVNKKILPEIHYHFPKRLIQIVYTSILFRQRCNLCELAKFGFYQFKIYGLLPESHEFVLVVRAAEDEGNNYLQVLKTSGLWKVCCGPAAYELTQTEQTASQLAKLMPKVKP